MIISKHALKGKRRLRIRKSIRKKISGTTEKPRLVIKRSNKYLYTQVIDDFKGEVITAASTLEKDIKARLKSTKDKEAAKILGEVLAERLKKKKIKAVLFDRNIYPFTGRVKVFADTARENGIRF